MNKKLNNDLTAEIVEYLSGTCKTLDEAVQEVTNYEYEVESLSKEALSSIDDEIFCCETCGWWSDVSDMSTDSKEDNICINCV